MSVRPPPQVELIRDEHLEHVLRLLVHLRARPGSRRPASSCRRPARPGVSPKCSCAHIRPVRPMPVCTSSTMKKHSFSSAMRSRACRNSARKWLSPPSAWMGSMMMAAMSSGWSAKALRDLVQRPLLGGGHVPLDLGRDREAQLGVVHARPAELGEEVGLLGIGVGERQRVAAAAVEGLAEVQDLRAALAGHAPRAVAPHLPVEGRLERVLDAEGAALDEERVLEVRGHGDARQRLHERRVLDGVDVGQRRLELGHPGQDAEELRVLHLRVVVADRRRAEERHEVEVLAAVAAVVDPGAVALLVVEDEREPVGEHVTREQAMDVGGGDGRRRGGGHDRDGAPLLRGRDGGERAGAGLVIPRSNFANISRIRYLATI